MFLIRNSIYIIRLQPFILCCRRNISSWSSKEVRSTFTDYFSSHGHKIVPSSSVIPRKGEGTYFTNAGMNQFKPIFLGESLPSDPLAKLSRVANSQKCIRVGGKHNDLEDVGHDLTHHTFFEMLGNWSFGDYFKREACFLAYDILTRHYKISPDRLYFTYFAGDEKLGVPVDEEVKDIWLALGVPQERLLPFGEADNFWDMGETGPCGPCTEIHFDHLGSRLAPHEVNAGSPTLVEIWNLVFMQYNRLKDGSLKSLPAKHVDTGMGLERVVALLNGSADNYSSDLFLPLFDIISQISKAPSYTGSLESLDSAYRILADHSRMVTIATSDGLLPSNENLGHKLRSVLYRCISLSRGVFGADPHLMLPALVNGVTETLACSYPELSTNRSKVCDIISSSIEHHDRHREAAEKSFNKLLSRMDGNVLSGEMIEDLEKGHFGSSMSLELITELAASRGLQLDLDGYKELETTRKVSSSPVLRPQDSADALVREMVARGVPPTSDSFKHDYFPLSEASYDFSGLETVAFTVCGLSSQEAVSEMLHEGQEGDIVLDQTSFYAEGGGQESDSGLLISETGTFLARDIQNRQGFVVHSGRMMEGHMTTGQTLKAVVFADRREGCMRNHTATHLLNAALAKTVSGSAQQGSSITPYKLTFDFLALNPVQPEQVEDIESRVRQAVTQELDVVRRELPLSEAVEVPNVRLLASETYPDTVAVVSIGAESDAQGQTSAELCGGTHVSNTGHLVEFCVTQLSSKSQNVKRITCVTGREAQQALLCGELLKLLSESLETANLHQPTFENLWATVSLKMSTLQQLIESRRERLRHSEACTPVCDEAQLARLRAMLVETDKSALWVDAMWSLQMMQGELSMSHNEDDVVPILKAVITLLRKGKDLELVQKSAREAAERCLTKMEHKVTEAINERMLASLCQRISSAIQEECDKRHVGFIVPQGLPSRQMAKVFRQGSGLLDQDWQEITLAHFSKRAVTIVHGVRADSNSAERYTELLESLNQVAPTKGKQLPHSGGQSDVFMFTLNSRAKDGTAVDKSMMPTLFPVSWFDSE